MPYSVEQVHAGGPEGHDPQEREPEIDGPQVTGCLGDARDQLVVLDRAGGLGLVKLHTAHPEHGGNGYGEDDDPHAPQPLQLLAVIEDRFG